MHDCLLVRFIRGLTLATVSVVVGLVVSAAPAAAQTAEVRYERAMARETALRSQRAPSVTALRTTAGAYEQIPRRFPRSGYADNALWQAAGLFQTAYERSRSAVDRNKATQLLQWLRKEYPTSSLNKDVTARLAELRAGPARPASVARGTTDASKSGTSSAPTGASSASVSVPAPVPPALPSAAPSRRTSEVARAAAPLAAPPPAHVESPAAIPAAAVDSARAAIKSIAYTKLPKGDRVTLELTQESAFTARVLANPDRLVLTFPDVTASGPVITATGAIRGTFVNTLSMDRRSGEPLQLSMRLGGSPRYSTFPLYEPYRLVIDIENDARPSELPVSPVASPIVPPATAGTILSTPQPIAPASTSKGEFSLARQLGLGVSRIVVDPGHGGHDPGAQANSVAESELVLDVALRLEKLLAAQPGFEVVLTRRTNQFVALEERTAIANRENADLFLSIHANSSPNLETRGIETFFLNFATTAGAEAVAARENASSVQAMHILPDLVNAIATSDKVAESRELATMVQASLMRRVGSLNTSIKDLGVKQAPFVVLIGARMPSVLTEISFLSNKTEAGLLKQAAHRQRIAQALADAILKYQASLKKVTAVAARTEGR